MVEENFNFFYLKCSKMKDLSHFSSENTKNLYPPRKTLMKKSVPPQNKTKKFCTPPRIFFWNLYPPKTLSNHPCTIKNEFPLSCKISADVVTSCTYTLSLSLSTFTKETPKQSTIACPSEKVPKIATQADV